MAAKKVTVDTFAKAVAATLRDYVGATTEVTEKAVHETAVETAKNVRQKAKTTFKGKKRGDKYYKSWTSGHKKRNGKYVMTETVYAKSPHYRLTHLLEKGHRIVPNGKTRSWVEGRPHIAPAEEEGQKILRDKIVAGIREAGK